VEILTKVARADPSNAQARWLEGLALNSVGNTLRDMGRPAEAIQPHQEALAIFETLSGADPANDSYSYNKANTLQLIGEAHEALAPGAATAERQRESWETARRSFERSAAIFSGMRERGTMSARLAPDAERVDQGLARCTSALASLSSGPVVRSVNGP
jgi:tetratricopeptide (TPR) repeat protein